MHIADSASARNWHTLSGAADPLAIELAHQRSSAFGLMRHDQPDFTTLAQPDLSLLLEQNRLLHQHAVPVMETLYEQIINTHHMVVLTDAQGRILHTLGDADFLEKADRVALSPGSAWSEQSKGTNAIGTAIAGQAPTVVHADQHYLFANHFLTCSASPIFDAQGRVAGVLDVTGDQHHYHRHTMALVRMSAQMIENQLFSAAFQGSVRVHFHSRPEFLGTLMEGMICFTSDGRFLAASRSGLFQIGLPVAALETHTFSSLFGLPLSTFLDYFRSSNAGLFNLALPNGMKVFSRCTDRQRQSLSVLSLRETKTETQTADRAALIKPEITLDSLLTGDPQLANSIEKLRKVAGRGISVMITGETGTGKEWLAQAIHQASARSDGPFIAINCASIPETLIESELFGYEDGAFTGARKKGVRGKILQAHGGTLFLDEIGDMPLHLQARLLRVLQDRAVMPLGGSQWIPVQMDVICATHQPLMTMIENRQFRDDLYYRLNGLVVRLPALRERSDLPALVAKMLNEDVSTSCYTVSPELMRCFQQHRWPGNLRQLRNVLRTALLMAGDDHEIRLEHMPDDFQDGLCLQSLPVPSTALATAQGVTGNMTLARTEQQMIQNSLDQHGGNVSAAARALGISRNTIYRKLGGKLPA